VKTTNFLSFLKCGLLLPLLLLFITTANANNLQTGNVRITNNDAYAKTMDVIFNLQWDNSWRGIWDGVESWDAAWVFIKFRLSESDAWNHAWISTAPGDNKATGGVVDIGTTDVNGTERGIGAFIYSATQREGGVIYADTQLKWDYGAQGINLNSGADVEISVHAIEMVHVAQGAFWAGNTNGVISDSFCDAADPELPVRITSEDALNLSYGSDTPPASYDIPSEFPKGYKGFYCMKYMVTQGQYVDFLNMQTRSRQAQLCSAVTEGRYMFWNDSMTSPQNWNNIHVADETADPMPRVYYTPTPYLLCNWIGWDDAIRYSEWAGLRPMTELEYEKACRGPLDPVNEEFAWGDTEYAVMYHSGNRESTGLETATGSGRATAGWSPDYSANCAISLPSAGTSQMPRAGIFATATSSRRQSGASYWGIMQLGCTVNEQVVSPKDARGLIFQGTHGSGGAVGVPSDWPPVGYGSTAGIARRGGDFNSQYPKARLADRSGIGHGGARSMLWGWRAVRTAP
jgi:formylglycine-generating enzyme required for sulfatase activity